MKQKAYLKTIALLGGFALAGTAHAAFPVGLWEVEQNDFVTDEKINTAYACFSGNGTYKMGMSTQYYDWNGLWKMNGRTVIVNQNHVDGEYVSAYVSTKSNNKLMTGYSVGWGISSLSDNHYLTTVWTYKGSKC